MKKEVVVALKYCSSDRRSEYGRIILLKKGRELYVSWGESSPIIDLFVQSGFFRQFKYKNSTPFEHCLIKEDKKRIRELESYIRAGLKYGEEVNPEQFLTHKNPEIRGITRKLLEDV